ncbi:MAG: bifunctional oligoribonuclease/PAP phosphatase NrnA [Spirochaetales bacterium]|uniref:Bifunctional oligoribonuclease/PAP phosphatase NrnA n=1 Tax=Candidatus Thalassospirochaeta sargassi TaxID=3119039 RepID=A0AAJ1MMQ3_9SPIO|nr:bifunctional oligoribonuclease/PAP phosphatase NrnA [Spirochaetales bacterium]
MLRSVPQELIEFIGKHKTFFIIGHEEPDGDCLGSQKALASMLNRSGKNAVLCSAGPFIRPETAGIEELFIKSFADTDISTDGAAVIITDCSTPERIGEIFASEIKGLPTAVIDHHASGQPFGDVSFVNGGSPSTTVMIYQLFKELKIEPTPEEAEDMMFGFLTDTGYFRHLDHSNSASMQLASELLSYGISLKELYFRMYGGRKLDSKILTGRVLSRAVPLFDGRCISIYEGLDEKKRFGAENRDSDTIYSQLLSVKGCEAVIFIREESENECSVSLRSRDKIDVGAIAKSFGGGGHMRAAGFVYNGSRYEIEERLKDVFSEIFA